MKITAEYKGKQVTFDVPDETLDKLIEEPKKKTGWEKLENRQQYWYVTTSAGIDCCVEVGDVIDGWRYDSGNYFTSKELAENIARYQSLDLRIRRRIAEICEPADWKDTTQTKHFVHCVYYSNGDICLVCDNYSSLRMYTWACDTEEHAEQIINEFREELMWYFTEFKDRMDG